MEVLMKIAKMIWIGNHCWPVWYLICRTTQDGGSYTGHIEVKPEEMEVWQHEYDRR